MPHTWDKVWSHEGPASSREGEDCHKPGIHEAPEYWRSLLRRRGRLALWETLCPPGRFAFEKSAPRAGGNVSLDPLATVRSLEVEANGTVLRHGPAGIPDRGLLDLTRAIGSFCHQAFPAAGEPSRAIRRARYAYLRDRKSSASCCEQSLILARWPIVEELIPRRRAASAATTLSPFRRSRTLLRLF